VPTYEYRCAEGHSTEAFQKMRDPPLKRCGACGRKVERVLFAPSIHYKGSGFYSTDHGKGKKAKDGKAEGAAATSEKKKDTGGDAKKASSSASGA
jgi:putative FmdB family regulatory protein